MYINKYKNKIKNELISLEYCYMTSYFKGCMLQDILKYSLKNQYFCKCLFVKYLKKSCVYGDNFKICLDNKYNLILYFTYNNKIKFKHEIININEIYDLLSYYFNTSNYHQYNKNYDLLINDFIYIYKNNLLETFKEAKNALQKTRVFDIYKY